MPRKSDQARSPSHVINAGLKPLDEMPIDISRKSTQRYSSGHGKSGSSSGAVFGLRFSRAHCRAAES